MNSHVLIVMMMPVYVSALMGCKTVGTATTLKDEVSSGGNLATVQITLDDGNGEAPQLFAILQGSGLPDKGAFGGLVWENIGVSCAWKTGTPTYLCELAAQAGASTVIQGQTAFDLMQIAGAYGAATFATDGTLVNLKNLTCSQSVSPGAKPSCTFDVEAKTVALELSATASEKVIDGLQNSGVIMADTFGGIVYELSHLACESSTFPGSEPNCRINTKLQAITIDGAAAQSILDVLYYRWLTDVGGSEPFGGRSVRAYQLHCHRVAAPNAEAECKLLLAR